MIVSQVKPSIPYIPGANDPRLLAQPQELDFVLNHSWVDANGVAFTLSAQATDRWRNTEHNITNNDVANALASDTPIFYADATHAMVFVEGFFYPTLMGLAAAPQGQAIDPEPTPMVYPSPPTFKSRVRPLVPNPNPQLNELVGMYAAIVTVTKP